MLEILLTLWLKINNRQEADERPNASLVNTVRNMPIDCSMRRPNQAEALTGIASLAFYHWGRRQRRYSSQRSSSWPWSRLGHSHQVPAFRTTRRRLLKHEGRKSIGIDAGFFSFSGLFRRHITPSGRFRRFPSLLGYFRRRVSPLGYWMSFLLTFLSRSNHNIVS
jgi:hypothetical protein